MNRVWREFDNPARKDNLRLYHWERIPLTEQTSNADAASQDISSSSFAKFNVSTNVYSYSTDEYLSHLRDDTGDWSREETDYLFSLCHEYDLRWIVIKDRWDWRTFSGQDIQTDPPTVTPATAGQGVVNGPTDQPVPPSEATGDASQNMDATVHTAKETPGPESSSVKGDRDASNAEAPNEEVVVEETISVPQTELAAAAKPINPARRRNKQLDRSIEDMKDRYYSVCRRLIRARPVTDDSARAALLHSYAFEKGTARKIGQLLSRCIVNDVAFLADREIARKSHIQNVLLKLSPEQLAEEEFLYVESRRLEQTYNATSKERDDMWRLLGGVGPAPGSALSANSPFAASQSQINPAQPAGLPSGGPASANANKKRRRGELDLLDEQRTTTSSTAVPQFTAAQDAALCITRYDNSTPAATAMRPAVYLRSTKPPPLKTALAPRITAALNEHKIAMRLAMPTKSNMDKLDALVGAITNLLDCKKQVERAEYELRVLKTRKEAAMRVEEEDRLQAKLEQEERERKEREQSGLSVDDAASGRNRSASSSGMEVDA